MGLSLLKKAFCIKFKGKREAGASLNAFTQVVALVAPQHCHILRLSVHNYTHWVGSSMRNPNSKGFFMEMYQCKHDYVCGIDLHSKMTYLCIINKQKQVLVHKPIPNQDTKSFESILKPYRGKIVIVSEACFPYYWVADFAEDRNIDFQLGHPLYMKHIHGGKSKNDRIDSKKIALLTMNNYLPMAHTCSREIRHLRDLMRSRLRFIQERSSYQTRVKIQGYQANIQFMKNALTSESNLEEIPDAFENEDQCFNVEMNIRTIAHFTKETKIVIKYIKKRMQSINNIDFTLLKNIRGIGNIIALTILLELDSIDRFANGKKLASYSRVVKCSHESAGKKLGFGNSKIGNPHLRYAFGEAAIHMAKNIPKVKEWLENLAKRVGKGKALGALAHKISRAVFHILKTKEKFELDKFLSNP